MTNKINLSAKDVLILGELLRWFRRNDTTLPTHLFLGLKDIVNKLKPYEDLLCNQPSSEQ